MYKPPLTSQRKHSSDRNTTSSVKVPLTPSPQWGRQKALAFARAQKTSNFAISFPLYLLRTAVSNSGRQLARSAGIQKGQSPFAHGGVRGTMGRSPCALSAVCGGTNGVYIGVVSPAFLDALAFPLKGKLSAELTDESS